MSDFYDLPPEERGYWYDRAERETGQSFHDLPAEERGDWYERATEDVRGWNPDGGE
jgi:hypothetical protein